MHINLHKKQIDAYSVCQNEGNLIIFFLNQINISTFHTFIEIIRDYRVIASYYRSPNKLMIKVVLT